MNIPATNYDQTNPGQVPPKGIFKQIIKNKNQSINQQQIYLDTINTQITIQNQVNQKAMGLMK